MTESKRPNFDIKPSEMMRHKRPELYSDSDTSGEYKLNRPVFGHHLFTLTERNEHKTFEDFCRALAQRELCRNLRPQTGPEGGGDGKVDTETYPVSEEIFNQWFVGRASKSNEKWAFAFSAKKTWSSKVRSDVKGIAETGRGYKQIAFFTNQNPRAKKRLEVEQELEKLHGIPVTIFDRNWIEEKVLQNGHQDLAYDILGVGDYDPTATRKGGNDTYRENDLSDIEADFANPVKSRLTDFQLVSRALSAAKLSRGLERPRYETDGRFERAIKWADDHGSLRQKFVARYEKGWTAIWWFDDLEAASDIYSEFEEKTLTSDDCFQLERLGNLLSIFVGHERYDENAASKFDVTRRQDRLFSTLEACAQDKARPNHALYAETLLELQRFAEHMRNGDNAQLENIWIALNSILDRATGLGEYPAEMLSKLIGVFIKLDVESKSLDDLVFNVAKFMGERQKDGTEGLLLLKRGQQKLDAEKPLEAIAWIGKAALSFNKKEYEAEQVEALHCLAIAYRAIDLLWAARSCSLSCIVRLMAIAEVTGEFEEKLFPTTKLLALICLQLGHLPDALLAIHTLLLFESNVSLSEEGNEKVKSDLLELDQFLACLVSVTPKQNLSRLSNLPDFLDHIQFYIARLVLLYRLGYRSLLREDQSIPEDQTDSDLDEFMSVVAAQPASTTLSRELVLNDGEKSTLKTWVLGIDLHVETEATSEDISIGEMLISTLEGFVATMLNRSVMPLTPKATIKIKRSMIAEVTVHVNETDSEISLHWPNSLELTGVENTEAVQKALLECIVCLIGLTTTSDDLKNLLEDLFKNEMAFARSAAFSNTASSHNRIFDREVSRLSNLPLPNSQHYELKEDAPDLKPVALPDEDSSSDEAYEGVNRHTDLSVHTVINNHLWDRAGWCGTAYMSFGPSNPPVLGLMFDTIEYGRKIFEKWVDDFGTKDEEDLIRISIVKGVEKNHPIHYMVQVSADFDALEKTNSNKSIIAISRLNLMEATTHQHLEFFISEHERTGCYFVVPVELTPEGPQPIMGLKILKSKINVIDAWKVGPNSQDCPAIRDPSRVLFPANEKNAPVFEHPGNKSKGKR